jgi:ATP-dependent Clp protease ATP-binding subunit ClpB
LIGDAGYDPAFGARPLKRVIQRQLADPIASLILEGKLEDGDSIQVEVLGDALSISPERI